MIDLYTKLILSIIAVSLVVLVGKDFVEPAEAQHEVTTHVVIDAVANYAFLHAGPLHVDCDDCR